MLFILFASFSACGQNNETNEIKSANSENKKISATYNIINPDGNTLKSRIYTPNDFERTKIEQNTFAYYLRNLPLKKHGEKVKYYNGDFKENYNVYVAVVDKKIGNKNLHQCADAIMHLRADYFYTQKQFNNIHFNFTNGMNVKYSEWIKGKRIAVKGNKTHWTQSAKASNTYNDFWNYMEKIFTYAGTFSLSKELIPVKIEEMQIGEVFIHGGFPGHGIIVLDMAENKKTGEKLFLLAQSYMPAQEIQILQNPNNKQISPWYSLNFEGKLYTPEWTFEKSELKRFP
ncbi:MAG: DUF4846 domain-containing protein [Bacteroidales bacterium]|nr:DUF4846 domain-containing protein [Bacteroidales bacterium]MBN2758298.1 DUF4846 domain-containing protein [Bacteroidales bacterium]